MNGKITQRTKASELVKNSPIRKALLLETAMETVATLIDLAPAGGLAEALREARADLENDLFEALVVGNHGVAWHARRLLGNLGDALLLVIEHDAESWGA